MMAKWLCKKVDIFPSMYTWVYIGKNDVMPGIIIQKGEGEMKYGKIWSSKSRQWLYLDSLYYSSYFVYV